MNTPLSRRAVLLGGAGMLLASCGGAGVLDSPVLSGAGFGVTASGTVQLWVRAATQALSAPIVAKFNATHPDLNVVMTAIPDTQYVTKLATAIRGRNVPDVVDVDDINSTLLAYHDALTDITDLVGPLPYLKQLSPGHLNLATLDDRIYAVPYAADVSVLHFNKTLFAKAGLDPAKPPSSLAELVSAARAITELGGGVKGISFGGNSPGILGFTGLPSVWSSKDYLFRGEPGAQTANIADNKALQTFLGAYRTMWADGLTPATSRTESGATWGKDFLTGKIGIWPGSEGALVSGGLSKAFAAEVGVAPLPGAVSGTCVFDGGDNIAIPRGAKNASGAWAYIQFALQVEQQSLLPEAGYTPIRSDVATAAFRKTYPRTAVAVDALPTGYAEKTIAYNTAVNQTSGPFFTMWTSAVFDGHLDGAVEAAQAGFTRALLQAQT